MTIKIGTRKSRLALAQTEMLIKTAEKHRRGDEQRKLERDRAEP